MTSTSDGPLAGVPLFEGLGVGSLRELLAPIELAAGEELWRQGAAADALYVIESGRVAITARLPGGREAKLAELAALDVLGELALLDGGTRTGGVRALEPTRLLGLSYRQFRAVVDGRDADAHELRRRLIELACVRLRGRHLALARLLPGMPPASAGPQRGEPAPPPDLDYLRRLPFLRGFNPVRLAALVSAASVERVARGTVLVAEGEAPAAYFVTLNGAVEEAIRREGAAIRVALAGPGRGFGYSALIAGGEATASAIARERSVVLALEPDLFEWGVLGSPVIDAIERDVVAALRQAERPQARLAAQESP